jgi:hypothetical protein
VGQFSGKSDREGGDPEQAEIGPSLDFYLKPLIRLQNVTQFDLDDAKTRPLVFSAGYRYMPQANGVADINRIEPVVTFHFPMGRNSYYPTGIVQTLTGRTVACHGVIATVLRSKGRSESAPITLHRTSASSSSTTADTTNGVIPQSMLVVSFLSVNVLDLSPTISTRTTRAKVRMVN